MILGLDVGGANTKAASSDGRFVRIEYLPLWKDVPLEELLRNISNETHPEALAAVMTGELADCFASKRDGIIRIKQTVERAFTCPISFWGVRGFDWDDIKELAAANWSASAAFLAKEVGDAIFVDMGSTTTDLIPIKGGKTQAETSDYRRLIRGELIYSGRLRTNLAALLTSVRIGDLEVPLSSELFAITADVYRALGDISEEDYSVETPDGEGKNRDSSLGRLARTVCSDLEEIGTEGALQIAAQARERQMNILTCALGRLAKNRDLDQVVAAGIGEELIEKAALDIGLDCIRLSDRYGSAISDVFPAYAASRLLEMDI